MEKNTINESECVRQLDFNILQTMPNFSNLSVLLCDIVAYNTTWTQTKNIGFSKNKNKKIIDLTSCSISLFVLCVGAELGREERFIAPPPSLSSTSPSPTRSFSSRTSFSGSVSAILSLSSQIIIIIIIMINGKTIAIDINGFIITNIFNIITIIIC